MKKRSSALLITKPDSLRGRHRTRPPLVISEQLLGTNTIVIIHHTDCGMLTFTNADIHEKVKSELAADADHIAFLPFKDLEQSVRDDIAFLRTSPLIPARSAFRHS
jgi:carbonic anhydrase